MRLKRLGLPEVLRSFPLKASGEIKPYWHAISAEHDAE
jgi:hypothetical protein